MLIREVEGPAFSDLSVLFKKHAASQLNGLEDVQLVGSGKGALALILGFLRQTGVLEDKTAEVLVPDWLGNWVYSQIQQFAFPSKTLSSRTRVMLVYHQYGFPQDMDRIFSFARTHRLVIIEDCAHALGGFYKGAPLGSFGDYAIYSFSKYCFCFALGGVRSSISGFRDYIDQATKKSSGPLFKDSVKWLHEFVLSAGIKRGRRTADDLLAMSYALYDRALRPSTWAVKLLHSKLTRELEQRRHLYQLFRARTQSTNICSHLEETGVTPYVIPIQITAEKNASLLTALSDMGIMSNTYRFDNNRYFPEPAYKPVLWIPCNGRITESFMTAVADRVVASVH